MRKAAHMGSAAHLTVIAKCSGLAPPAGSPRQAAAAAATSAASNEAASAAAATASAAAAASAATASTASAAASGKLYGGLECSLYGGLERSNVFLVENVERRQTDVGDFLVCECDFVALRKVIHRRHIGDRHTGRCGGASC
jgi:hypothetical protein